MHTRKYAVGLLALTAVLVCLVVSPAAAHLKGALWTTTAQGEKVNANLYDQKCGPEEDWCTIPPLVPYLNGGPSFVDPSRWVPFGDYYFQVTDPPGKVLLSTDDIECRRFRVEQVWDPGLGAYRKTVTYPIPDPEPGKECLEEHRTCEDAITKSTTIELCPYDDTPNNGGVYKLWITNVNDYLYPEDEGYEGSRFGFVPAYCKTDNFKVKGLASVWGDKVDALGDPVEGLHIVLYKEQKVKGQVEWVFVDDTCTDADGEFSFTELSAGKYKVVEDFDLSLCDGCGCIDYTGKVPLSPTEIVFNITKADLGGKGKDAGPGEPIYIGQFVNDGGPERYVALAGLKFYDKNGNGNLDAEDTPLAGWGITLEEKTGPGTWQQAYRLVDDTPVLVEPQPTDELGAYSFLELPADKVYRICEYVWVDLDEDGYLGYDEVLHPETDYTYDATTYTFGGELVDPATAGWLQTAPSAGDPGPYSVAPPEAEDDVTVDVPGCCCFVVAVDPEAPEETVVSNLLFGNTLAELCVEKRDACTNALLDGFEFNLYECDCTTPITVDGLGQSINPITTDGDDDCWHDLLAGDYCVVETPKPGWVSCGPTQKCVTVEAGGSQTVTFYNWARTMGLTPGYWKNWRNHYTDLEFQSLLVGTIAASIAEADAIFEHWDASPGDELTILKAFLLANQLTLNLTQSDLPNPSDGSLVLESSLECYGTAITLGDAIDAALDCLSDTCSREDLLMYKNWLACFAEARYSDPPCECP